MIKGSHLFTEGRVWDEKVGSHLVNAMGWELPISWLDGMERVGKSVANIVGSSVGNVVGKAAGV